MKPAATTGTGKYEQLLERCRQLEAVPTAVAYPLEETALAGPLEAAAHGLITPILVGPKAQIEALAKQHGLDLGTTRIVDVPTSHAAAAKAVELVRTGEAELLMKGSLHSDELLGAVVSKEGGLRTARRISHVFIMDVPTYHKVLVVTDGLCRAAPEVVDRVREVRERRGVRIWSVVLGHRDTRGVDPFSDEVLKIDPNQAAGAAGMVRSLGR